MLAPRSFQQTKPLVIHRPVLPTPQSPKLLQLLPRLRLLRALLSQIRFDYNGVTNYDIFCFLNDACVKDFELF